MAEVNTNHNRSGVDSTATIMTMVATPPAIAVPLIRQTGNSGRSSFVASIR